MHELHLPKLAFVLPCYNEFAILQDTLAKLNTLLQRLIQNQRIDSRSYIYCVDDGSHDDTWRIICEHKTLSVKGMRLQYNVGQQLALLAGIHALNKKVDCIITLDADLQDDIDCVDEMLVFYCQGVPLVYGVRNARQTDSWFKRFSAALYYRVVKRCGVNSVPEHADFRLIGKEVIHILSHFNGPNIVLRSLLPQLRVKSAHVFYERQQRLAGESKYPLKAMLSLAWRGISSESVKPLHGMLVASICALMAGVAAGLVLVMVMLMGGAVSWWLKVFVPIFILFALQFVGMSVIAGYLANVYTEVRTRPRYLGGEESGGGDF